MAALTEREILWQQNKNIANNLINGIPQATSQPEPNAYGRGGVTTSPGSQQGLQAAAIQQPSQQQETPAPTPITLQPAGLKQAVTTPQPAGPTPVAQSIPVGRYGWKGTSESNNGQPTLVFGTPGQDNSGVGSWRPGSATPGGLRVNAAPGTSARFASQPETVGGPRPKTPLEISIEALDRMRYGVDQGPQQPKYLTREEGAAMGLGWKGRLNKYNQDIEMFKSTTGQAAARDLEQMRQAGAGFQTLAQAQTENDKLQAGLGLRTAQTAEATAKANAENQLTAAATAFGLAKEGSPEQATAMRNYMLLSKQMGGLGKAQEPIIKTVKEEVVDPVTKQIVTREKLVQVDPTKSTFTGLQDAGQQSTVDPGLVATMKPEEKAAFDALPKARQDAINQKWLAAQAGGK